MCQDPRHEPEDWADFLRRKRDNETQHQRDSRNDLTSAIYSSQPIGVDDDDVKPVITSASASASPSARDASSTISNITTFASCLACRLVPDGLVLMATNQRQWKPRGVPEPVTVKEMS